jgi:hypothetical protein
MAKSEQHKKNLSAKEPTKARGKTTENRKRNQSYEDGGV